MPEIDIERIFELGVVLAARTLWEELGIGPAIRACTARAKLTAPHETALFAMAANRLDDPISELACAERWLPDAAGLAVDQCYRALDVLAVWSDEIEREVFLKAADLFRLDVDLIFYDTTTAYFENAAQAMRSGCSTVAKSPIPMVLKASALAWLRVIVSIGCVLR